MAERSLDRLGRTSTKHLGLPSLDESVLLLHEIEHFAAQIGDRFREMVIHSAKRKQVMVHGTKSGLPHVMNVVVVCFRVHVWVDGADLQDPNWRHVERVDATLG